MFFVTLFSSTLGFQQHFNTLLSFLPLLRQTRLKKTMYEIPAQFMVVNPMISQSLLFRAALFLGLFCIITIRKASQCRSVLELCRELSVVSSILAIWLYGWGVRKTCNTWRRQTVNIKVEGTLLEQKCYYYNVFLLVISISTFPQYFFPNQPASC